MTARKPQVRRRPRPALILMPPLHCTRPACPSDPFEAVGDYRETHLAARAAGWTYSHAADGGWGYLCPRHNGWRAWWPDLKPRLAIAAPFADEATPRHLVIEAAPDVPRPEVVGVASLCPDASGPGAPDVPQPVLPPSSSLAANDEPPGLGHPDDTATLTVVHGPQWAELAAEIERRDAEAGDADD